MTQPARSIKVEPNEICSACLSRNLSEVIDLPDFPQIAIFADTPDNAAYPTVDQAMMICEDCGHLQLRDNLDPAFLYNDSFTHRTSNSATASKSNLYFADYIKKVAGDRRFDRVIEVGCNDTFLLRNLLDVCGTASGVDPVWRNKESQFGEGLEPAERDRVKVVGDFVENVDFDSVLGGKPDLVVSSFVFEHIREPRRVLENLFEVCADDALFVIQVPGTDMLLDNCRFDQISHQHYQQFTLDSFIRMIEGAGGEYVGHDVLYSVWGAIMVAFRKGAGKRSELDLRRATSELVAARKARFDQQIDACLEAVRAAGPRKVYGLGAAQNFSSLAYFMGDVGFLEYIIDDDPARQNKFFPGFPVKTSAADENTDYSKAAILITAPDYGRVLIGRANQLGAEQCILPVNII